MLAGELRKKAEVVFIDAERFDGDVQDVDAGDVVGGGQAQRARGQFVDECHAADVLVEMTTLLWREPIGKRGKERRFGQSAVDDSVVRENQHLCVLRNNDKGDKLEIIDGGVVGKTDGAAM